MMKIKILVQITIFFVLFSCSSTYKYMKLAKEYEANGYYKEATQNYYTALKEDPSNIKATVGLRRVGQKFVDNQCYEGDSLFENSMFESSYSKFSIANEYIKSSRKVGVELQWSSKYKLSDPMQKFINDYINKSELENTSVPHKLIKEKYLEIHNKYDLLIISGLDLIWPIEYDSLYFKILVNQGNNLYSTGNLHEALNIYQDILSVFPNDNRANEKKNNTLDEIIKKYYASIEMNYKIKEYDKVVDGYNNLYDLITNFSNFKKHGILESINKIYTDTKEIIASIKFENNYKTAEIYLKNKKFKSAYDLFEILEKEKPNYKNIKALLAEAKNKAVIRVGLIPFKSSANCTNIGDQVCSNTFQKLFNESNRYIKYFDRENLADILQEQALSMTGIVDEETAIEAGKIAGLNFMVLGKISSCYKDESTQPVQVINAYNVTSRDFYEKYYKEVYNLYTQQNEYVTCNVKTTRFYGSPANVTIYRGYKKMNSKAQILVINVETAEILSSDYIDSEEKDDIKFAECAGADYTNLSISIPKDVVKDDCRSSNDLLGAMNDLSTTLGNISAMKQPPVDLSLFRARRVLIPDYEMFEDIIDDLTIKAFQSIKSSLEKYIERN